MNVSVHDNLRKLSTILLLLLTMKITNSDKCCEHGYMFKLKSFVLYFCLHCLIKVVYTFNICILHLHVNDCVSLPLNAFTAQFVALFVAFA